MGNTFSSRNTLKTKLFAAINAATTADQIVKLSRSIEKANLDDDADLETALDTKVSSLAGSAEPEDLEKLAFGVKKLRTPEGAGVPTSTMVAEGSSNLYVTQDRVRGSFSAAGDLSYDSGTGVLSYTALPDALTVYATVADLPASGVAAGAKGIVEENKKLYIFTGASWIGVGLVDQKPNFTTTPDGSYTLSPGADTVITLSATDPQGDAITFSHQVTAGSLGGSTVSQSGNVFTITGSTNPADTAPFSITFSASDGTNVSATTPSEFTVVFGVSWSNLSLGSTLTTSKATATNILLSNSSFVFVGTWQDGQNISVRLASDPSNEQVIISAPAGTSQFGYASAVNENWLVVSADIWDINNSAVYVYAMSDIANLAAGGDLGSSPRIIAAQDSNYFPSAIINNMGTYGFGKSLALGAADGNRLVISNFQHKGERWDGFMLQGSGAVYLMDLDKSDPAQVYDQTIVNPDSKDQLSQNDPQVTWSNNASADDGFGASIVVCSDDPDIVMIAAPYTDINGPTNSNDGRLYFYNINNGNLIKYINMVDGSGNQLVSDAAIFGQTNELNIGFAGNTVIIGSTAAVAPSGSGRRGRIVAFDYDTGNFRWQKAGEDLGQTENSAAFGRVATISPDGDVVAVSGIDWGNNDNGKVFVLDSTDGSIIIQDGPHSGEVAYGIGLCFTANSLLVREQYKTRVFNT